MVLLLADGCEGPKIRGLVSGWAGSDGIDSISLDESRFSIRHYVGSFLTMHTTSLTIQMMIMQLKISHYAVVEIRHENDAILSIQAPPPVVDLLLFEEELHTRLRLLRLCGIQQSNGCVIVDQG